MSRYELLAPAGSYESLIAAVKAGADAVYVGGNKFGARAYADNLSKEKLLEAIDYVHLYGRKIYLTLNTLLKEEEMGQLYEYLLPYYRAGLDAVLVQDFGVLSFIREYFPDLEIHASTQMNVMDLPSALLLKKYGVSRIVTARELSLKEIREISKNSGLEIESFVHGALCYCYSGQCLMSSILGGRSGNRGRCAQPCRLPYEVEGETKYYLSPKDMSALPILPKLMEAGVYSFKIEGRMKRPEYVALVTSIYRKYIDLYESGAKYSIIEEDEKLLLEIYNRGGFNQGYYEQRNGKNMMAKTRPNHMGILIGRVEKVREKQIEFHTLLPVHKLDRLEIHAQDTAIELTSPMDAKAGQLISLNANKIKKIKRGQKIYRIKSEFLLAKIQNEIIKADRKKKIFGKLKLRVGEKLKLELICEGKCCKAEGQIVQAAKKNALTNAQISAKIKQSGDTEFDFEKIEIDLEGECFVPVSALKQIRRDGLRKLREEFLASYRRNQPPEAKKSIEKREKAKKAPLSLAVSIMKLEYLPLLLSRPEVSSVYIELEQIEFSNLSEISRQCKIANKKLYYMLPYVFRMEIREEYEKHREALFFGAQDGMLVRNIDSLAFLLEGGYKKEIKVDSSIYCYNQRAIDFIQSLGTNISFTYPLELREKELKDLVFPSADMICYSRFPLMISAQCIKKTRGCCDKRDEAILMRDRYKNNFIVKTNCRYCYNLIYNTVPLSLLDCEKDVKTLNFQNIRLHFVEESIEEAEQIIENFSALYLRNIEITKKQEKFTRGHFRRGIE